MATISTTVTAAAAATVLMIMIRIRFVRIGVQFADVDTILAFASRFRHRRLLHRATLTIRLTCGRTLRITAALAHTGQASRRHGHIVDNCTIIRCCIGATTIVTIRICIVIITHYIIMIIIIIIYH